MLSKETSAPSSLHSPSPLLCIIHHRGLLPCFPRLFLPSMPVTLTESPNPLLLPTARLLPSGSWITSLLFYPFSHSLYLRVPHPSLHHPISVSSPLQHLTCSPLSSFLCLSIIHISVPSPMRVLTTHLFRAQSSPAELLLQHG